MHEKALCYAGLEKFPSVRSVSKDLQEQKRYIGKLVTLLHSPTETSVAYGKLRDIFKSESPMSLKRKANVLC